MEHEHALVGRADARQGFEEAAFAAARGSDNESELGGGGGEADGFENGAGIGLLCGERAGEIKGFQHER